jgi:hypothetical protein
MADHWHVQAIEEGIAAADAGKTKPLPEVKKGWESRRPSAKTARALEQAKLIRTHFDAMEIALEKAPRTPE